MKNNTRTNGAHRTVRSRLGSFVAAGAASALLIGGFALVTATPASAAGSLSFGSGPASAVAGVADPVTVTSPDANDNDVVTLSTTPSLPTSDLSDYTATLSSQTASFPNFEINVAGSYTVTATDTTNGSNYGPVTSPSITISAGSPHQLAFTTEPPSSSTLNTNLTSFAVTVQDVLGNTITTDSTDLITLTPTGSCTLGGTDTATVASGVATFGSVQIASGTSCILTATASVGPGAGFTTNSSAISLFGTATKVAFTAPLPPTTATIGTAMSSFKVSVEDVNGSTVTSSTNTIGLTTTGTGSCALSGTVSEAAVAGVATFTGVGFTSGTACNLVATDTTTTLATATSASISLASNAASKLGFTTQPPSTATAGSNLSTFAVSIEESNGIPTASGTDTIVLTSTCKLVGTTSVAANAGVATFNAVSIQTAGPCTLVATDSTHSLTTATSSTITVAAGVPTHVVFTTAPPTTQSSVTTPLATFKVSVEDVYGNVTATSVGSTDTIAITSPCVLTGTTSLAAVAGVATFSAVTVTTGGTCVLTATDTSRSITTATASTTVGSPQTTLVVTSTKGSVGTALKLTTSGGSGTGAVTYAVVNGTATCTLSGTSLKANKVGTCVVTATKAASSTYALAISAATTISFGPAGPKATRVVGAITSGRTSTVTVIGSGFSGRPRVISNVAGFSARVTKDTGKSLTIVVKVRGGIRAGTHVMTIILGNGKRTSVKYTLH